MSKFRWLAASLAFAAGSLSAQNLIINNTSFPLSTTQPVTIDPSTGDVRVFTQNTTVTCSIGGTAPSVSLSVAPTTVTSGASVTVSWQVGNANACSATGGAGTVWSSRTSGSFLANNGNGSVQYTLLNTGGSAAVTTFNLSCSNDTGSTPRSASVTVNPATVVGCEEVNNPLQRLNQGIVHTGGSGDLTQFSSAFGFAWPGNPGLFRTIQITSNRYVALAFTSDSAANVQNRFEWDGGTSGNIGPSAITIARCPGDFRFAVQNPIGCYKEPAGSGTMRHTTRVVNGVPDADAFSCDMDRSTTYYLNIVHADPQTSLTNSLCPGSACAFNYTMRQGFDAPESEDPEEQ